MRAKPTDHVPLWDRIEARIERVPEIGCWIWTGGITRKGYASFKFGDKTLVVHRYVYERLVGPIPAGLTLDHVAARGCVSKACVNPAHLEPTTTRVNVLRGGNRAAVNARKTTCPRGHPYDKVWKGRRYCTICQVGAW